MMKSTKQGTDTDTKMRVSTEFKSEMTNEYLSVKNDEKERETHESENDALIRNKKRDVRS